MQKARSHPLPCPKAWPRLLPLVCTRFQVLFHSPSGVLFTVPSRYSPLSVTNSYLALEDGPPRFDRDFSCPGLLGYSSHTPTRISRTGLSPSAVRRSSRFPLCFRRAYRPEPLNPAAVSPATVWALPLSLAATQGISSLISLPPGTEMFQFPGLALPQE